MPVLENEIFSVSQVAETIHSLIGEIPALWVRGEVSNLKFHQNGNIYFNIKDQNAKISAVLMNYSPAKKNEKLLKEGLEIIVFGRISYYKKEGYITLFVEQIDLLGEGILKQKFEELKRKLEAEGLFSKDKKKKIPEYPEVIGIITSPTGAAIRDILNITKRRAPNVHIIVFPVAVQGENAPFEIAKAIEIANKKFKNKIDVLIVGRGGGSIEDLWSFNEEIVARAIFNSEIPIVSAVGHEIDYTIADYVADLRAPTPSAAAEIVLKDKEEIKVKLSHIYNRLTMLIENYLQNIKKTISHHGIQYLYNKLKDDIEQKSLFLDNLSIRLDNLMKEKITNIRHLFLTHREKLKILNPTNILERGYTITYYFTSNENSWKILKTITDSQKAEKFKTTLKDGEIITTPLKQ
ncbi:MAG: exodeoxyribonuclease VII large subunit [Brevinematales bacterium]|nr:exodeoxyribonuclease VII large subunit [Brevinematales bacterium]